MILQKRPVPETIGAIRRIARRVAGVYFLFAMLWIVLSDLALFDFVEDVPSFAGAELLKGAIFVLVTSALLYLFISYRFRPFLETTARIHAEGRLITAEDRYRALFERSLDCVFLADLEGNFLDANRAALDLLGYRRDEIPSISFKTLLNAEQLPLAFAALQRIVETGTQQEPLEFTVRRKDGGQVIVEIQSAAVYSDGVPTAVLGIARDVTERKHADAALRESEARFRTIVEQSTSGFCLIQDGKLAYVNVRMIEIFGYASADEIVGKSPMELVAAKDRETVAANIRRLLDAEVSDLAYSFTGLRKDGSEFVVGVHGSFTAYQGRPTMMGLLQDISERKRAEEEIQRYILRLEQAMQSTINVVATIGELRDPYTHGHERRVGEIATAIATEMGLDDNRVEGIRIAGYLHDVGKIGVPAEILSKPTRLTNAEFELVKDHARQSYEILKTVQFPWPVAEVAWQHHERLDGSGYPRGLKGNDIITEARVLAVADVVEAMSSHRPYRPGLGIELALAEIERNRGKLYDPLVVDACLRLFRERGYTLPG